MYRKISKFSTFAAVGAMIAGLGSVSAAHADGEMLKKVQERGVLVCGVSLGLAGLSVPDSAGNWTGIDVDLCRGVAAAIFDDPSKVQFIPLTTTDRFTSLQAGSVDVLARNTSWTMGRETSLGMIFSVVNLWDGQSFTVRKDLGINSARELSGATICMTGGTTFELNVADYFRAHGMEYQAVVFGTSDETVKAYEAGRCDVYTSDAAALHATRVKFENPDDHIILPERISLEPLGPAVRQGDEQWLNIVKWTHFAMVAGEEMGVTSDNVEEMRGSDNPQIKRLLGSEGNLGETLGLTGDWALRIIRHVGNYEQVYNRNVGSESLLKIERGINSLWSEGGLQFSPPIR